MFKLPRCCSSTSEAASGDTSRSRNKNSLQGQRGKDVPLHNPRSSVIPPSGVEYIREARIRSLVSEAAGWSPALQRRFYPTTIVSHRERETVETVQTVGIMSVLQHRERRCTWDSAVMQDCMSRQSSSRLITAAVAPTGATAEIQCPIVGGEAGPVRPSAEERPQSGCSLFHFLDGNQISEHLTCFSVGMQTITHTHGGATAVLLISHSVCVERCLLPRQAASAHSASPGGIPRTDTSSAHGSRHDAHVKLQSRKCVQATTYLQQLLNNAKTAGKHPELLVLPSDVKPKPTLIL